MVRAAISGALDDVEYVTDPIFGLEVPTECHGVPSELLQPRGTWQDPDDYDARAADVAKMFVDNSPRTSRRPRRTSSLRVRPARPSTPTASRRVTPPTARSTTPDEQHPAAIVGRGRGSPVRPTIVATFGAPA
ncbi:MAG: hypothetical protein KY460_01670 [Actinobacteria bacterium]|nr:hypothetical protein [Actinomycetota bacterium]